MHLDDVGSVVSEHDKESLGDALEEHGNEAVVGLITQSAAPPRLPSMASVLESIKAVHFGC